MAATLFKKVDYSLAKLIHDIEFGDIGLPDIQRPFVWTPAKVRDLFDSMHKGFPVGYLLFWSNDHLGEGRQIGIGSKQAKIPRLLIVDGQQRLTSLYAVLKGLPVMTRDFRPLCINIAFRPRDGRFEVADAAIARDPEFIPNISALWTDGSTSYKFVKQFLSKIRQHRDISDVEEEQISGAIDHVYDLQNYPFTAMEISSTVDEEQVADIFVRINSQGVQLRQADFILTLLSVFWDEGRAELEQFSRESRHPSAEGWPSPYNHFIQPDPDQLLRVSVAFGFRRARLQHVYSILRGKDLETGQFSDERREQQFAILREAQGRVLDLQNWHDFLKGLVQAGFRSGSMISSQTGLLYTYAMYLIGKYKYQVAPFSLRNLVARWFFMTTLTGRYTASPESAMDQDLARLRNVSDAGGFIATLNGLIAAALPNDYWDVTLVSNLEAASARSPAQFAYYASLNLLGANVLFSRMKVSELLDPALQAHRSAIERHHLFPRGHLKKLGYESNREINQVANFALVEWGDNTTIGDEPPSSYFPRYAARFGEEELRQMMEWHALPEGWHGMDYQTFLIERRRRMAQIIRQGFERLSEGTTEDLKQPAQHPGSPTEAGVPGAEHRDKSTTRSEGSGPTSEDYYRLLTRIPVPPGQQQLYEALYDAGDTGLTHDELVEAMGRRDRQDLAGVLGALGRRVNETPGYGKDRKPATNMVISWEQLPDGQWRLRLRPEMRTALESLRPVWL